MALQECTFQDQSVKEWWMKLCTRIGSIKKDEKRVVIVALSRKMPRFFKWVKDVFLKEQGEGLCSFDIVEECEMITEHAIPFVVNARKTDSEYIIVDDTIIYGETMRSAADLIYATTKQEPYISSIFVSNRFSTLPNARMEDISQCSLLEDSALLESLRYIAERNIEVALPLDVEYPILYFKKEASYLRDKAFFLNDSYIKGINAEEGRFYKIVYSEGYDKLNTRLNNYTLISNKKLEEDYNNDFAKVRFFESLTEEQIKVVAYAPNVLAQSAINKDDLFINPIYKDIWKDILDGVKSTSYSTKSMLVEGRIGDCLNRSLTVFANYLFSLSTFIRTWNEKFLKSTQVMLDKKDLQLILGSEYADKVYDRICTIISQREVSPSKRRRMVLPPYICSSNVEEQYEMNRILAFMRNREDVEKLIKEVFVFQHFSEGITKELKLPSGIKNPKVKYGETFDSLLSLYSFFGLAQQQKEQAEMLINRWIDTHIDEGTVVPKYDCVRDSQGIPFWRRHFTAGAAAL